MCAAVTALQCTELLGWTETARAPVLASVAATHKDMRQYSDSAEWYRRELRARDGNAAEVRARAVVSTVLKCVCPV